MIQIPTYMMKKYSPSSFHFPCKSIPKLVIFPRRTGCGLLYSFHLTAVSIFASSFGFQNHRRNQKNGAFRQKPQRNYIDWCLQTFYVLQGPQIKGNFIWKGFKIISTPFTIQFPFMVSYDFHIIISFLHNMAIKHLS